jgi:hypothetical protein
MLTLASPLLNAGLCAQVRELQGLALSGGPAHSSLNC